MVGGFCILGLWCMLFRGAILGFSWLQKHVKTLNLVKPSSFDKISKKTKKIAGKANKNATIVLRDPSKSNGANYKLRKYKLRAV